MNTPIFFRKVVQSVLCGLILCISGCSSLGGLFEANNIDYKSVNKAKPVQLEVPPDLTQLKRDSRLSQAEKLGSVTASGYNTQVGARLGEKILVAPKILADMHIERLGTTRWLVIKQTPEVLWPQLKEFWQDNGFLLDTESAELGVMETDWAENRAKIPQDILRNALGTVFDGLYSSGERDKFRIRLERVSPETTEVYLSHRGVQEVLTGKQKEVVTWVPRAPDPDLEAEFLTRLMVRLGLDTEHAKTNITNAINKTESAQLLSNGEGKYIEVQEEFDRTWRRVGLTLDRIGFTVEDRDRQQGIYFVRYVDQDLDTKNNSSKGFFSKLFTSEEDKEKSARRYKIFVKNLGGVTQISVLGDDNKIQNAQISEKILSLLIGQLK